MRRNWPLISAPGQTSWPTSLERARFQLPPMRITSAPIAVSPPQISAPSARNDLPTSAPSSHTEPAMRAFERLMPCATLIPPAMMASGVAATMSPSAEICPPMRALLSLMLPVILARSNRRSPVTRALSPLIATPSLLMTASSA